MRGSADGSFSPPPVPRAEATDVRAEQLRQVAVTGAASRVYVAAVGAQTVAATCPGAPVVLQTLAPVCGGGGGGRCPAHLRPELCLDQGLGGLGAATVSRSPPPGPSKPLAKTLFLV